MAGGQTDVTFQRAIDNLYHNLKHAHIDPRNFISLKKKTNILKRCIQTGAEELQTPRRFSPAMVATRGGGGGDEKHLKSHQQWSA